MFSMILSFIFAQAEAVDPAEYGSAAGQASSGPEPTSARTLPRRGARAGFEARGACLGGGHGVLRVRGDRRVVPPDPHRQTWRGLARRWVATPAGRDARQDGEPSSSHEGVGELIGGKVGP